MIHQSVTLEGCSLVVRLQDHERRNIGEITPNVMTITVSLTQLT